MVIHYQGNGCMELALRLSQWPGSSQSNSLVAHDKGKECVIQPTCVLFEMECVSPSAVLWLCCFGDRVKLKMELCFDRNRVPLYFGDVSVYTNEGQSELTSTLSARITPIEDLSFVCFP